MLKYESFIDGVEKSVMLSQEHQALSAVVYGLNGLPEYPRTFAHVGGNVLSQGFISMLILSAQSAQKILVLQRPTAIPVIHSLFRQCDLQ